MDLPETALLAAFESVARHRNFRKAAAELHLTPSAVSHRLRTLESQLDQPLLIRTTRTVALTTAGEALLPVATEVLSALRSVLDTLRTASRQVVTIVTTDSVATCWLIDRLPSITDQVDVEVRVLTIPAGVVFDPTIAELGIAYGRLDDWPSGDPLLLAAETIYPVCSPQLATAGITLNDLWSLPLLADENLLVDWPTFAQHVGATRAVARRLKPTATYNHSHLALRAAASGHGITLASGPLAGDAIKRGELARPVTAQIDSAHGYYLIRSQRRNTPAAQTVYNSFAHELGPIQ